MAKQQQVTVRFSPDELEQIKKLAEKEHRPMANFIAWVVLRYVENSKLPF